MKNGGKMKRSQARIDAANALDAHDASTLSVMAYFENRGDRRSAEELLGSLSGPKAVGIGKALVRKPAEAHSKKRAASILKSSAARFRKR